MTDNPELRELTRAFFRALIEEYSTRPVTGPALDPVPTTPQATLATIRRLQDENTRLVMERDAARQKQHDAVAEIRGLRDELADARADLASFRMRAVVLADSERKRYLALAKEKSGFPTYAQTMMAGYFDGCADVAGNIAEGIRTMLPDSEAP